MAWCVGEVVYLPKQYYEFEHEGVLLVKGNALRLQPTEIFNLQTNISDRVVNLCVKLNGWDS